MVPSMSARSQQTHPRSADKDGRVPDLLIRGEDMLDRVHRVCEDIDRRAKEVIERSGGSTHEKFVTGKDE